MHVLFILRGVVVIGQGYFRLGVLLRGPSLSLFDMFFVTRRFMNLMFLLWFTFLGGSFVSILNVNPSLLFIVFCVLWLIYH